MASNQGNTLPQVTNSYARDFYAALSGNGWDSFISQGGKCPDDTYIQMQSYFRDSATPKLTTLMVTRLAQAYMNPSGIMNRNDPLDAQARWALSSAILSISQRRICLLWPVLSWQKLARL